jgi:RNA polymerase sigma factor (sigma-70 family)
MRKPPEEHGVREWLEHRGWVRELARRLVSDSSLADDVAQEAWVAVLERPRAGAAGVERGPDAGSGRNRHARAWLAAVTRDAARQLRRSEGRRRERERLAARGEALPSTAELLERAALQRRVAEAVEGLAEPYRSTLLLRYLEELPPR